MFSPDDLFPRRTDLQVERSRCGICAEGAVYGLVDMDRIAADPWSVHLASEDDVMSLVTDPNTGMPRRLVQTFLYARMAGEGMEDNQYAHPLDIVPVNRLEHPYGRADRWDGPFASPEYTPGERQLSSRSHQVEQLPLQPNGDAID